VSAEPSVQTHGYASSPPGPFTSQHNRYAVVAAAAPAAAASLARHAADVRPRIYTQDQLERGATGDVAWNAAQREMIATGRMHGYMRMYWAKQLLLVRAGRISGCWYEGQRAIDNPPPPPPPPLPFAVDTITRGGVPHRCGDERQVRWCGFHAVGRAATAPTLPAPLPTLPVH